MRIAVFADVHSNLEALETAVAHAAGQRVDDYFFLGDAVGYGANPNECFEWAIKHCKVFVIGNHERAVTDPALREWFNPEAREAIVWTAEKLAASFKKQIEALPYLRIEKDITFVHGSPDEPEEFRYLMRDADAVSSFEKLETPVGFVGHTHVPCCFIEQEREVHYWLAGIFKLKQGKRHILNPGSIGQPRDRDRRLSYGIFDGKNRTFEIVRLEYDNEKAAAKIRKAGLPKYLADRLL